MSRSPDEGGIRPSRMRRNVVLPQPLAPTMLTNSRGRICSEMFASTGRTSALLRANCLLMATASSLNGGIDHLPSSLEVKMPPRRDPALEIFEHGRAENACRRQNQHADEHARDVEHLRRERDQVTQAFLGAKHLADEDSDQSASDPEA